jgi:hypothetical protein
VILGPDALLTELGRYAESGRPPTTRDTFVEALAEAEQLRSDDPRSEPAALFFALAKRSRAMGGLAEYFVTDVVRAVAEVLGYEIAVDDVVLTIYRARILRGFLRWPELNAAFAERLRAIGGPEIAPPKRPR